MNKGILIYNRDDYEKNKWFAQQFITKAPSYQMDIALVITDELTLEINNYELADYGVNGDYGVRTEHDILADRSNKINHGAQGFQASYKGCLLDKPDFVINRSRDSIIGAHFELMGCRVFNSSLVTEICNNKAKTYQAVNSGGIRSVKTMLCSRRRFNADLLNWDYPLIVKSVGGHGGSEVFKADSREELIGRLSDFKDEEFVIQQMCSNPGKDIRVFVLGREIVAAVKRISETSFKSNYSLGGGADRYTLSADEKTIVEKIINIFDFDLVGIDFILDKDGSLLFNEIEDAVGTRTLYKNYDIDIVDEYLGYISKHVNK